MTKNETMTTWIIVIVVVIIVIGLGWWYIASQNTTANTNNNSSTPTTTTQTQSSLKAITSFDFPTMTPQVNGVINNTDYTIALTVPRGTDVTNLTPTITVSGNANISPSFGTPENFTNPVTYTVIAQDGSTQIYTVTIMVSAT